MPHIFPHLSQLQQMRQLGGNILNANQFLAPVTGFLLVRDPASTDPHVNPDYYQREDGPPFNRIILRG